MCSPLAHGRLLLPEERRRKEKQGIPPMMNKIAIANRSLGCVLFNELQFHFILWREGALAQLVQAQFKETISLDILHNKILTTQWRMVEKPTLLQDLQNPSIPNLHHRSRVSHLQYQLWTSLSNREPEYHSPSDLATIPKELQICGNHQIGLWNLLQEQNASGIAIPLYTTRLALSLRPDTTRIRSTIIQTYTEGVFITFPCNTALIGLHLAKYLFLMARRWLLTLRWPLR